MFWLKIRSLIRHATKSLSETYPATIHEESISNTIWSTKYYQNKKQFSCCGCGHTMNKTQDASLWPGIWLRVSRLQ